MDLGDRMKSYEDVWRQYLPIRMPLIIRVDGRTFHTFTRNLDRPFDLRFAEAMQLTAAFLVAEIQNAQLAYVQSDEISILLVDFHNFDTEQWFRGNLQKIVSLSASLATVGFNSSYGSTQATFDSRAFILPTAEVNNYFFWRQQDATRNSIQMVGQANFSHKQLHKQSCTDIQEMLFQKGINWNDLPTWQRRGAAADAAGIDLEIPVFSKDHNYVERFLQVEETP